jgi:hypothetical protein
VKKEVESKLASELIGQGYSRLEKQLFSAPWSSSQVDHRVSPYWLTKYGYRIGIAAGVLHHEAHRFGVDMLRAFGSPHMRDAMPGIHGSFIGFALGNLCSWPSMWSLDPAEIGIDSCVQEIVSSLQEKVFPLVGRVNDDARMYDFLIQTEIKAFLPINGVVLTAQAMLLGKRLGLHETKVVGDLTPFLRLTSFPIDNALSVEDFFKEVWSRA